MRESFCRESVIRLQKQHLSADADRVRVLLTVATLFGLVWAGCSYDPDKRCGANLVLGPEDYCVCPPNSVEIQGGNGRCQQCGSNEEVRAGKCECVAGTLRAAPGQPCMPSVADLGKACEPTAMNCTDARFSYCAPTSQGGYCTQRGCNTSADCAGGYACRALQNARAGEGGRYCRRPPIGLGKSCAKDADCADGEATACDTMLTKGCLQVGCTPGDDETCHDGYKCCDLSKFGATKPVCLPLARCP